MFGFLKARRREQLRSEPFPAAWAQILEKNCPFIARLPDADREELRCHVRIFLAEKTFEGCGGLEITEEIKVTVAAQACLLLLHRETDYYPRLYSILVYPSAYVAKAVEPLGPGFVIEGEQGRLGEAWKDGVVVLAWDAVLAGAADMRDGENLVLHEFAHQLDHEDGAGDGAPVLPRRSMYVAWARVLGTEYEELRLDSKRGRKTVLDRYGATNPAEFFAVATECFFEKPVQLRKKHPELYEELKEYYLQDPEQTVRPEPTP
jgi:Mlc titration factor MtfA (ptsG expression regulator)